MSTEIESLELKISSNSKSAAKGIDALTQSLTKLKNATKGGAGLSDISKELGGLSSTSKGMGELSTATKKASGSFTDFYHKISVGARSIKTVITSIKSLVDKSSDYNEVVNLFSVSMGKYASAAYDYANKVSDVMGIDPGEWMKSQGIFMTLASGFGVAGDRASKMSEQLTQLGYDIASFQNIKVEDAMTKLKSGLAGELEPLRAIGYDLSQAKLEATALELGIDKSVSNMTQAEKAQLRYYAIMTQVTTAHGDMARTLEDPANQMRILKAQFEQAARAVGNIFLPAVQAILPYITAMAKVVRELAQSIANFVGYEMPEIDTSASDSISNAADSTNESLEEATDSAKKLKSYMLGFDELNVINPDTNSSVDESVSDGFDFELPEYDFLGGATSERIDGIVKKIKEMIEPLQKIVDITKEWIGGLDLDALSASFSDFGTSAKLAMTAVSDIIIWLYQNILLPVAGWMIETLLPAIINLFNKTAEWLSKIDLEPMKKGFEDVGGALENIANKIIELFTWLYTEVLLPIAEWAAESGVPAVLDAIALALEAIGFVLTPVVEGVKALKPVLEPIFKWIGEEVIKIIGMLGEKFKEVGEFFEEKGGAIRDIIGGIGTIIEAVWNIIKPILDAIMPWIQTVFDFAIGILINDLRFVIDTLAGVVNFLAGVFTGDWERAWDGICGIFGAAWEYIKGIFVLSWEFIVGTLTTAWDAIVALFSSVGKWFYDVVIVPVGNFFKGLWEDVSGYFSNLWKDITKVWDKGANWFDSTVITPIKNFFKDIWTDVSLYFKNLWTEVSSKWQSASDWFNRTVVIPIKNFFYDVWSKVKEYFSSLWTDITNVWNTASTWFNENVVTPIVDFFKGIWTSVSKYFSDLWTDIQTTWTNASTWFDESIIQPLGKLFDEVTTSIGQFFDGCWLVIKAVWEVASTWFEENFTTPVKEAFEGVKTSVSKYFSDLWTDIQTTWTGASKWFDETVTTPTTDFFKGIWTSVSGFFSSLWTDITTAWVNAPTWFNETVTTPVVGYFEAVKTDVSQFFTDLWTSIKTAWTGASKWFDEKVTAPITGFFEDVKTDVKGFFNSLWNEITAVWEMASYWFETTVIDPIAKVFDDVCGDIGEYFDTLWFGIRKGVTTAINAVIGAFELLLNWMINGINNFIGGVDRVIQWAADVLGQDWGGISLIQKVEFGRLEVPTYAEGGFPEQGQMFIAREAGAEMVGNIGRRTAVANNDQIVSSIAGGVAEANEEQNALLREQNSLLRAILEKDSGVYLDGKNLTNSVEKYQRERGRVLIAGGAL